MQEASGQVGDEPVLGDQGAARSQTPGGLVVQ